MPTGLPELAPIALACWISPVGWGLTGLARCSKLLGMENNTNTNTHKWTRLVYAAPASTAPHSGMFQKDDRVMTHLGLGTVHSYWGMIPAHGGWHEQMIIRIDGGDLLSFDLLTDEVTKVTSEVTA